jgi:hypothetical protein
LCGSAVLMACTATDAATAFTTSRIACVVPPGVGAGWSVFLRGFWVSLGPSVGYAPPNVTAVSPGHLPIAGGVVTVTGSGFGPMPCALPGVRSLVEVRVTAAPLPGQTAEFSTARGGWVITPPLPLVDIMCNVLQWSPSSITCTVPPGLNAAAAVLVTVGGQLGATSGSVAFEAPVLFDVVTPAAPPTVGGTLITVYGRGFPPLAWPLAVVVGGALCEVVEVARSDTRVTCHAPRGGGAQPVVVFTPLQSSNQSLSLTYAPPRLASLATPRGRPVEGGFPVVVTGEVGRRGCSVWGVNAGRVGRVVAMGWWRWGVEALCV